VDAAETATATAVGSLATGAVLATAAGTSAAAVAGSAAAALATATAAAAAGTGTAAGAGVATLLGGVTAATAGPAIVGGAVVLASGVAIGKGFKLVRRRVKARQHARDKRPTVTEAHVEPTPLPSDASSQPTEAEPAIRAVLIGI
jgi:hypothetical protein